LHLRRLGIVSDAMAEERPTLYLIDGSGYVFRAFFALPQLTTSRGLPSNAV